MPARTITIDGVNWWVSLSGRRTQYSRDEYTVIFLPAEGDAPDQRAARFTPRGSANHEAAFAELTDGELLTLFQHSQPAWTTSELEYRR